MTDSHSGSDYETKDVSKLIRLLDKIDDSNNVFKCYLLPDTDQVYACKKIVLIEKEPNKPNRGRSCGLNFKAIRKLVHPNIIKHHKVLFYDHAVLIVMDFYPSGSVNELIVSRGRPLTLKLCKVWFAQILGAVSYIHFKGMSWGESFGLNFLFFGFRDCTSKSQTISDDHLFSGDGDAFGLW